MQNHKRYLLRCLQLAFIRAGFCAPNPAVGCVIVKNNKMIAEGFHFGAGFAHAEINALDKLSLEESRGATLYVSLEPCCHYGRTPPCVNRIIEAGIKKVFFALKDPNKIVSGKGQKKLIRAGIACELMDLRETHEFYRAYIYWHKTKLPYVTFKLAMSRDYKIAHADKSPAKITGKTCEKLTHQLRLQSDAILTSIETIIHDNPKMNVRLNKKIIAKNIYILDSKARLPLDAEIFKTAKSITLFYSANAKLAAIKKLEKNNVRCILIPRNHFGLHLKKCLESIGADGVHQLWIEAGAQCFHSFLKQDLLNEIILYVSKKKLGKNALASNILIEQLK